MIRKWLIYLFIVLFPVAVCAQEKVIPSKRVSKNQAVQKLGQSLESRQPVDSIANDYMKLAQELAGQKQYARAENYFLQAAVSFGRIKNTEQEAVAYRELAKVQEYQQKIKDAIQSYNIASRRTQRREFKLINLNDVSRLQNPDNLVSQSAYIQSNINLSNTIQNKQDAVLGHQQMAQVNMEMKDNTAAIDELENALELVKDEPEETSRIKGEIAKVYVVDAQYDKAISINQSLVEEARTSADPVMQVIQLQKLSQTYHEANQTGKAISTLEEAYEVAIETNQTIEARNIVQQLARLYVEKKRSGQAMETYSDFISRLDTLVKADSTLVDEKFFQLHEAKIAQLENERALKDELIARKNMHNNMLWAFLILSLLLVFVVARSLYSINKKNMRIALQSLRREMNPHFIFNSLNSVNQFIAQNNELEANKYLTSYSRLMRNIMENSNKDFITLTTEIDQLRKYLELEHLRFNDKFSFRITVDENIDTDSFYVPNMLIQPQLENAIWHGLRYKDTKGNLNLTIKLAGNRIEAIVEDNGIGLLKSKELKTAHQKQHNSRGLSNTRERIQLLNKLYHLDIDMTITDKTGEDSGAIVVLSFPVIDSKLLKDEHITEDKKRNR